MIESRVNQPAICFDDILLVPQTSKVRSRADVDLSMHIENIELSCPIISAPMDTVTGYEMLVAMSQRGGLGILHRYTDIGERCAIVHKAWDEGNRIGAAVGATGQYLDDAVQLVASGATVILVDVANGHSEIAADAVKQIRDYFPGLHIMAGNVATAEGYINLAAAGASSVRVGIGGGSACTTRGVTGHGLPTLASIIDCYEAKTHYQSMEQIFPAIVADGGLRSSGDIVKAFAAGADAVMLGGMLAGTDETPGEVIDGRKQYRGMASAAAQRNNPGRSQAMVPEGISTTVPVRGSVRSVLDSILSGVSSGCSYSGADRLSDLCQRARYSVVNAQSLAESRPHASEH